MDGQLTNKLHDLNKTRALCSEIIESGAKLHDLLQKEPELRSGRSNALRFLDGMSRNLETNSEHNFIDQQVSAQLVRQDQQLSDLTRMCDELEREEKSTKMKIKKKAQELERMNNQYLERFRNLDYLEHELDLLNRAEQEKMEENERRLKQLQQRLREEEWRLLRGEQEGDGDELLENSKRTKNGQKRSQSRQKMHNEAKSNGAVMYGSMNAPDDSESG